MGQSNPFSVRRKTDSDGINVYCPIDHVPRFDAPLRGDKIAFWRRQWRHAVGISAWRTLSNVKGSLKATWRRSPTVWGTDAVCTDCSTGSEVDVKLGRLLKLPTLPLQMVSFKCQPSYRVIHTFSLYLLELNAAFDRHIGSVVYLGVRRSTLLKHRYRCPN